MALGGASLTMGGAAPLPAQGPVEPSDGGHAPSHARSAIAPDSALLQRILRAEDTRATDSAGLAPIRLGLRSGDSTTRRIAVRALGRMERPIALDAIVPLLGDPAASVRAEAANALGQIVPAPTADSVGGAGDSARASGFAGRALAVLRERASVEPNDYVRGVLARTIGRLPYATSSDVSSALEAIRSLTSPSGAMPTSIGLITQLGAAHGLESLVRRNAELSLAGLIALEARWDSARHAVARSETDSTRAIAAEIRGLLTAVRARVLARAARPGAGPEHGVLAAVRGRYRDDLRDQHEQVRRQALAVLTPPLAAADTATRALVREALGSRSAMVRLEALRAHARLSPADCAPFVAATTDANPHVALAAIDALGQGCADRSAAVDALAPIVARIPATAMARASGRGSWHAGAHALVALARLAPERAVAAMPPLVRHPVWQLRMYAARAAAEMRDTSALLRLASDAHDNVREAAVAGLVRVTSPGDTTAAGRAAARVTRIDSVFVAQLARPDYQLVLTAAQALRGAPPRPRAVDALLGALARITAQRRETSRDSRMELLARIRELGTAEHASRLRSYLRDFDPVVAARVAEILRQWGDASASAAPQPIRPVTPSLSSVAALRDRRVRFTMAARSGGGSFEMRLLVDEAPLTVGRFAALARRGTYNGLTFHRVAPNFVVQGLSPGANEYEGHDPYMRDEVGLVSHRRGTVGISTRGRDTGDAQIFVNLIDNWRLDHQYTVYAQVVRGMDVVDGILEGDVVARVEILPAR